MSKKFRVVNRETNEPLKLNKNQYIVLYDSGYSAIVTSDFYDTVITVDPKIYKVVWSENFIKKLLDKMK